MEQTLIAKDIDEKIAIALGERQRGKNGYKVDMMRDLLIWGEREWGGKTLVAIGNDYGLSGQGVRHIHARMTRRINYFMEKNA